MEEKILNEEVVETTNEKDLLEDNEPVNEDAKRAAEELSKKEEITEGDIFDIALKNDSTISEEDREIVEKLKSNNYDFRKTLNDSLEDIFSRAYGEFINENIENIKYFLTSEEPEKTPNRAYNVKVDSITYKWKDEFFIKVDSFKTTKKDIANAEGIVELYLLNLDKVHEKVAAIPAESFTNDLNKALEEIQNENNEKKPTLEDMRAKFYNSLIYIIDRIQTTASKGYFDNKYRFGDVYIVDKLLDPKKIKGLYEDAIKLDKKVIGSSNKSYLEKFVKRIEKDFKKNNLTLDDNNKEALILIANQLAELFMIVFTHVENEIKGDSSDIEVTISKIRESENTKEYTYKRQVFKNVITKALYKTFVDHVSRASIPALSFGFQNRDLEETHVMVRLFEVADYILKPQEEIKE